ncbi:MAG: hypothetical protein COA78_30200 [Blastopirellula sp.]|nr:MAG: hypothetical protein COA78_30200 [Blastopirellula sp.]
MTYVHTDDVPNTFDPKAQPTPESSAVLHDMKEFDTDHVQSEMNVIISVTFYLFMNCLEFN